MKTEVKLGATTYTLEDEPHSEQVYITRVNSDGTKQLWIPRQLILDYAAQAMADVLVGLLKAKR